MSTNTSRDARTGTVALVSAAVATVVAPIHALARYATEDGRADLALPGVRTWAEPAREALLPLLDWSDPDTVYLTWGKTFLFFLLAATLAAFAVRQRRAPAGLERWGWRVSLTGYVLLTASTFVEFWTPFLEEGFLVLAIPGLLVSLIGSGLLGAALLRRGFRPRAAALLLLLWLPLLVGISNLVSLGAAVLPMLWAWALAGRTLGETAEEPALSRAGAAC